MTDAGGPQRRALCFLSTLLSQKVPEKADLVLRCMISGQPKPEVTWYKNGQTIDECDIVSSYEFFEHQYIHVLHLSCCTKSDAAVYQISAKNCLGMICCSATIEVEGPSENPRLPPDLGGDRDAEWKRDKQERNEEESTDGTAETEHPCKEEGSLPAGAPTPPDSSSLKINHLHSPQLLANNDIISASSSGNAPDVKGTRQTAEADDPNSTGEIFLNSNNTEKQDASCHRTESSTVSRPVRGGLSSDGPNDELLPSTPQNPKAQKYISFSLPLSEATAYIYSGDSAPVNKQPSPQVSSEDSDSDYELCPEITLTCMEEFSDDDLEYLECSDVMTDYTNAVWQRSLQGTEHVFLLESDDEETEFSECSLGGREMGCGPRVSGDMGPMDATTGFCGYHSQLQEVGVKSSGASRHSPSSLLTGMTLTLGPHQDGTALVSEQGRCPLPTAFEAAENDYPGIQGETRDRHQAGEEFASDNLLTMDEAVTETEVKPSSGGLEKSGMKQSLEIATEERGEERDLGSRKGIQKPARVRRPGARGKAKKLTPKESAAGGTLAPPPKEPARRPPGWSHDGEIPCAKATAPGGNSHFHTGECAISQEAEQDTETLPSPADSVPKEEATNFKGEGMPVNNLFTISQFPDQSDHPQGQNQETARERSSLSQTPAFPEPAGKESSFTGTTTDSFSNLWGINKENASLAQYLEGGHAQGPQQEEEPGREGHTPASSGADEEHEQNTQEANAGKMSLAAPLAPLPWDASAHSKEPEELQSLSAASPGSTDTSLTLENVCKESRGREAACVTECFGFSDQGMCCDTMDSPVGAPADKYLPQEICCMDYELTEGQSKVHNLCPSDDKTLAVLLQTRGSEPPESTCENSKDKNTAVSPLFISTVTWNMSQEANEGAAGGHQAEVENSSCILSSTAQAGQKSLIALSLGGCGETHRLSSEDNTLLHFKDGGDQSPSVPVTIHPPVNHGSIPRLWQEMSKALTANVEGPQVAREIEDKSIITVVTEVHSAECQVASISENSIAVGVKEGSPQAPDENVFQFPSKGQLGHLFGGSTTECTKDSPCLALSVPEVPGHVPPPPEGEGFCNISHLQVDNHSRPMSQPVDRADIRSLEEDFQEKGSETKRRIQLESPSCQGFLSADDFQESLPPTPAAQGEASMALWGHSPAKSREERRSSSGLGSSASVMVEVAVEGASPALSSVPTLPETLQEPSALGNWGTGAKLRIITLEASVSEIWPPRQGTDPENREAEAGSLAPDEAWTLSGAAVSEAGLLGMAAWAQGPQAETAPALVNRGETCEGEAPVGRGHRSTPPSRDLSPPRLLESSVDPIEKELRVTESLPEASEAGWKKNANHVSKDQEEDQLKADPPAFFKQFLSSPNILESSVDPIDDRAGVVEHSRAEQPEPSESPLGVIREGTTSADGNLGQRVNVQPTILQVPYPQDSGETIPSKNRINQDQVDREREEVEPSQYNQAEVQDQPATWPGEEGGQRIPSACRVSPVQEGSGRTSGEAEQGQKDTAKFIFPTSPLSGCLSMTHAPVEVDTYNSTVYEGPRIDDVEPRNHQCVFSDSKERGTLEHKCGKRVPSSSDLAPLHCASSPEGTISHSSLSHRIEELKIEEPQIGETKPPSSSGSPQMTLAFISRECESETTSEFLQDLWPKGSTLGREEKAGVKKPSRVAAQTGKLPGAHPAVATLEEVRKQHETSGSGHLAEGVKKKILSRVAALRLRLEEKENVRKNSNLLKKIPKLEKSLSCTDEKKDLKKVACKREGKAPVLLKKIQAEIFPDHPGNVKLSCQFAEVHEDSTICWTKDSKSIAQVQRSAGDNSAVSLAIVQASQKDQGLYCCCIKNSYGKVTAEFNLTAEVLKQLLSHRESKGCEEIEFSQLIFKEDFLNDSYFGGRLRGQIATEALHFGEGVHRKAFRSTVMQGLTPVFQPGHACVLKVHNAVAHGTRNNDELIQRNYKLAAQECYVQNTARHYAKIYAAEAQPLEGFGEVPEIIPIFLIHRPENNIPYATVEEELIGEFVKYSIRDGKEINFLRRESEAGQKCCTFQHWVYQKTSGCLLVTDMQGVGMKLTDVGIATLAKGYKGFKGNCSMTFIDQFKALHQCNKYCKMLGLKSLQNNTQKPKKPSIGKSKVQISVKKPEPGTPAEKKS
ncbi:alpha-protein kinase 2 isoform X1 [Sciurus carolinensis]|uniref:alpha-protein kinase 2 isoform X1 n=2 Tax=Sciurus carolinensis TaxID=30640 RepID=UPI001FB41910|nr:alpha-protein kinase 2 isoform X1 [Sciurus carolinensis]